MDWAQDFIYKLNGIDSTLLALFSQGGIAIAPIVVNVIERNNLIEEVRKKLLYFEKKKGVLDDGIAFAHSGFFAPLLGALERKRDDGTYFDVRTVINYEGPNVDWSDHIDNPYLKSIINVWGTAETIIPPITGQFTGDYYVDIEGDLKPINDPTKKPVPLSDFGPPFLGKANFSGPAGITNINIEIKNARHNDFSYDPSIWNDNPYQAEIEVKEINIKTNLFMRALYRVALDDQSNPGNLSLFLSGTPGISFDSGRAVWVVDTAQLEL